MARQITETITDDIDGSRDAQEVRFSYQGTDYIIDLGKKNRAALDKALQPYIEAGTRVSTRSRQANGRAIRKRAGSDGSGLDLTAVRSWAVEKGYTVSSRGRVPRTIIEAYRADHG